MTEVDYVGDLRELARFQADELLTDLHCAILRLNRQIVDLKRRLFWWRSACLLLLGFGVLLAGVIVALVVGR